MSDTLSTSASPRRRNGQYEHAMRTLDSQSRVSALVYARLEEFLDNVRTDLNDLPTSAHLPENQVKAIITDALASRFGRPTAKTSVSFVRGPSTWNGYQRDHYKRKLAEMRAESRDDEDGNSDTLLTGQVNIKGSDVVKALGDEWREMTEIERADYPQDGHTGRQEGATRRMGDKILPKAENWARKRKQISANMKRQAEQLNKVFRTATLIFWVDTDTWQSEVWHPDPEPGENPFIARYVTALRKKNLDVGEMAAIGKADATGAVDVTDFVTGAHRYQGELDRLRKEFRTEIKESYNRFAVENEQPRLEIDDSLPDKFFTEYLPRHNCILRGAEDVQRINKVKVNRLRDIIRGMHSGMIGFVTIQVNEVKD